jgi:chromosome segregation ATPase
LDFIAVALDGKKIGFDKIIAHIDDMVAELGKEQQDDEDKKEYCNVKMDSFDDKKKALEKEISDLSTSMTDAKEQIQKLGDECGDLEAGIESLDKQVAEGTAQRQEEHSDFLSRQASNNAAKQLLEFAKNRLNKFYNPKQYKPEAKADEALFLQKGRGAPQPPPQALLVYKKKGEESSGVIQMINRLIADLEKDTAEAEVTEKDAQADYEAMLSDAKEKRIADVNTLEEKSDARTQLIAALDDYKGSKSIAGKSLGATEQAISNLHGECDFLLKYFDVRKEARMNEVDALKKCKAVLNGADDA